MSKKNNIIYLIIFLLTILWGGFVFLKMTKRHGGEKYGYTKIRMELIYSTLKDVHRICGHLRVKNNDLRLLLDSPKSTCSNLDKSDLFNDESILYDEWGSLFVYRGGLEIVSKGEDKVLGTKDDLVFDSQEVP